MNYQEFVQQLLEMEDKITAFGKYLFDQKIINEWYCDEQFASFTLDGVSILLDDEPYIIPFEIIVDSSKWKDYVVTLIEETKKKKQAAYEEAVEMKADSLFRTLCREPEVHTLVMQKLATLYNTEVTK